MERALLLDVALWGIEVEGLVGFSGVNYLPRSYPALGSSRAARAEITVDPEIHESILAAATCEGVSVSAWMTDAAREALQRRAGLAAVALWEKRHGPFTEAEMDEARRSVRAQLLRTPRRARRSA